MNPRNLLLTTTLTLLTTTTPAQTPVPTTTDLTITDNPAISQSVTTARNKFLAMRAQNQPNFTRLDATILIKQNDGTWQRGHHGGEELHYPASTVKMAYMAAAAHWETTNNKPVGHLQPHVGPMITDSDNPATGRVIDAITGTTNVTDPNTTIPYETWKAARMYTANFLTSRGLLANQTIHVKTYPTNSGPTPIGYEQRMWQELGRNAMQTNANATLLLEIVTGKLDPRSTQYMRQLMTHPRWGSGSVLGFGLPPGATYENKPGCAYDTLADFAYIIMPQSNQEIILTVLSNAYTDTEPNQPRGYTNSILGVFTELLIEELNLDHATPPKIKIDNTDTAHFTTTGNWTTSNTATEKYGPDYLITTPAQTTATATWTLNIPQPGKYEICTWHPQHPHNTPHAIYTITHNDGQTTIPTNQQHQGGRWVKLGDYNLTPNQNTLTLTNTTTSPLTADAIKLTKWP